MKLLATMKKIEDGYVAMVAPFMISDEHPLYNVHDVFNAIFVHGNVLDDAMFYGRGAGKLPTASAVVADVVDIAKHLHRSIHISWSSHKMDLLDQSKAVFRYLVRADRPGRWDAGRIRVSYGRAFRRGDERKIRNDPGHEGKA